MVVVVAAAAVVVVVVVVVVVAAVIVLIWFHVASLLVSLHPRYPRAAGAGAASNLTGNSSRIA